MPKGQTRIDGLDDKRVGLHAGGLTVRDIQAHLLDLYGLKVSPDLIGRVSDAVLDEVREWQCRAPDRMCPVGIFDALRVKFRDAASRTVKNKAVDVTLGVTREGPGLWIAEIAEAESDAFEETWAGKYASIAPARRRARAEAIAFFAFDPLFTTTDPPDQSLHAPTPENHFHHERDRKSEPRDPENDQEARLLRDGRGGDQADLSRHPKI